MAKISEVLGGAAAIAKGMSVTFREMLNPTLTEDYPEAPAKFQERYRGVHELQRCRPALGPSRDVGQDVRLQVPAIGFTEETIGLIRIDADHGAVHLRHDVHQIPGDVGVIGALVVTGVQHPPQRHEDRRDERRRREGKQPLLPPPTLQLRGGGRGFDQGVHVRVLVLKA